MSFFERTPLGEIKNECKFNLIYTLVFLELSEHKMGGK